MLIKIGDAAAQYGISHRALHYWESAGILRSSRAENDYRYYDEANLLKIRQIVALRKLRLSIPSIQEIFASNELSKVVAVLTDQLNDTVREAEQLNALGLVLRQLINMLKDRQNMATVYNYLDANHSTESAALKAALQTVLSEPVAEITVNTPPEPLVDLAGIDLSLAPMTADDIAEVTEVVKRCYANTAQMDLLFQYFAFERQLNMPDCTCYLKIMQGGECIGVVNLAYVGMEATLIRCLAYGDPDNNVYLFELLKRKYPGTLCWMIRNAPDGDGFHGMEDFNYDWEGKKQRFWEDNGFVFYTSARYNQFIKMMKPHDEVYNSSRYRFALLDGSMDGVSFRFFGLNSLDFYDGAMPGARFTDVYFADALVYDTTMMRSRFTASGLEDCDFRYVALDRAKFEDCSFQDCALTRCNLEGMTIDGVNVMDAIRAYAGSVGTVAFEKTGNPGPYKEEGDS